MWTRLCGIALLGVLAGCSTEGRLRPSVAPGIVLSRGGRAATIEEQGVRLSANGSSWKRDPWNLPRYVTPVELSLENHSGRTLRIQYAQFELLGEARYIALNPRFLSTYAPEPFSEAGTSHHSSTGRRELASLRSLASVQDEEPEQPSPPRREPVSEEEVSRDLRRNTVPSGGDTSGRDTGEVQRLSVKEGLLEDGACLSGFLYFQNVGANERQVTLQARMVDANTGETFTTLRIPFEVLGSSR